MGEQFNSSSITMQAFFFLLLAAVAFAKPEAEADPAVLYANAYYAYPYAHYAYGYPYAHTYAAYTHAPVTYTAPVAYKPYTYYANSGGAVHIVKRDAEPKADADAQYYYGRYYGYARPYGYYGYPYGRYYWGK